MDNHEPIPTASEPSAASASASTDNFIPTMTTAGGSSSAAASSHSTLKTSSHPSHWKPDEHGRYLEAMALRPRISWKAVADIVMTKNSKQCRSHHSKVVAKRQRQAAKNDLLRAQHALLDNVLQTRRDKTT